MKSKIKDIVFIVFLALIMGIIILAITQLPLLFEKCNTKVTIDGYEYDKNSTSITLIPKTDEYIKKIEEFKNLKEISIHPFKYNVTVYCTEDNEQQVDEILNSYTDVNDLYFLENYPDIEYLNIRSCRVENMNFITEMNNLKTLVIKDTLITDISLIVNLKKLKYFDISNCSISNYDYLLHCPELEIIYVSENQIDENTANELTEKGVKLIIDQYLLQY